MTAHHTWWTQFTVKLIHAFTTLEEGLHAESDFDLDAYNCHDNNSLSGVATDITRGNILLISSRAPIYK